jgi:hypothetical protein
MRFAVFVADLYNAAAYIGALWYHPGMIGNGSFFEWLGGAKYLSWVWLFDGIGRVSVI